jgi:pimeloyl-ACP methyl ester carboxylesterase
MRLLMVMVLLVLLIVALVWRVVSFFLTARLTRNLRVITGVSILFGTTAAISWFMAPPLGVEAQGQFAVGLAGVVLLVTTMALAHRVFTPARDAYHTPQPRPDTQYWSLPTGSRLAYTHFLANGTPQPIPVVYLHGGPGIPTRAANYDFFRQLTQDGYDVYLYDQVGSGRSARLTEVREYTTERHVADLEAIRQEINAEQVILIGQSWGNTLAADYMTAYPEHVARVIFSSPGALWDVGRFKADYRGVANVVSSGPSLPPLRVLITVLLAPRNPFLAQQIVSERDLESFFNTLPESTLIGQYYCQGDEAKVPDIEIRGTNQYVNRLTFASQESYPDPRPAQRQNQTPTLILRGECEFLAWEVAFEYKETLPNATLLSIPNAGHALYGSQPELILAVMRAFLLEQPLPLPPYTASQAPIRN